MKTYRLGHWLSAGALTLSLGVGLLLVLKPGIVRANEMVTDSECTGSGGGVLEGVPVGDLAGLFNLYPSNNANSASWDNGSYHYQTFLFGMFGPGGINSNNGLVRQNTEINSWDCNGTTGQESGDEVATDGTSNVGGSPLWWTNGQPSGGIQPVGAYLGSMGGNANHNGVFLAYAAAPGAAANRPPVFMQDYGSAAAVVDDGGRAVLTDSSGSDKTIMCEEFDEQDQSLPDGDNPTCAPDIQGDANGKGDQNGAGYMQSNPDCLLSNPNAYNKGREPNGKGGLGNNGSYQCDGTTGDPFSWYDSYPGGAFGTIGSTWSDTDNSGEDALPLTPLIGNNSDGSPGTLKNFELHFSAVNTFSGGFGVGMFITLEYPHDKHSPVTTTPVASCSATDITGTASDADDIGGNLTVSYSIDGGTTQTTTTTGDYSIDLSGVDQLKAHTVSISVGDITVTGTPGNQPPATASVTYGPCYTPTCGAATSPGIVEPGETFAEEVVLGFTALNGAGPAPPGPGTIGGTLTMTAFGQLISSTNSPTVSGNFTAPADAGSYVLSWTFKDGTAPPTALDCTGPPITIGFKPYLRVFGGDVLTGSVFASSTGSCTQPSDPNGPADVIGWNKDGNGTNDFSGAGSPFAVQALGVIDGFASGQATATNDTGSNQGDGLSFSNTSNAQPTTDEFGGAFGLAPCAPDYFGQLDSATATPITNTSNFANLTSGSYYYDSASGANGGQPLTLPAISVANGVNVIIYVSGNVYITGNITYTGASSWTSFEQIPQLKLVVSGNIFVAPGGLNNASCAGSATPCVSELDGIYVAQPTTAPSTTGFIYDCTSDDRDGSFPSYSACNNQLTVHGSFVANEIKFMRTYGSLINSTPSENCNSSDAAEVFCYSPELWLAGEGSPTSPTCQSGDSCFESITSLPPIL